MDKQLNWIKLALRSAIFLYIPSFLLLLVVYQLIFGVSMRFQWLTALTYLTILANWVYAKYKDITLEEDINDYNQLERVLLENGWEILDRRRDIIIARPMFDLPFNMIIDDKVEIQYNHETAIIKGPKHYVTALSESIQGEPPKKHWQLKKNGKVIIAAIFLPLPFIRESGVMWEVDVLRHNIEASEKSTELEEANVFETRVENSNNNGHGVENDENIFYIHGNNTLVRTDKEFNSEKIRVKDLPYYIVQDLNLVGDWLYFTGEQTISKMKTDGSELDVIYDLGDIEDVHVTEKGIYFINVTDNFNVYRMDMNGKNLKRVLDVEAKDIAIYDDELLVSQNDVVEQMNLDGEDREVILNEAVRDLVRHDGFYYYIGSDGKLYKRQDNQSDATVLVDRQVGTYTLTKDKVIYTLRSENNIHPSNGIHETDHNASPGKRVYVSNYVNSLTKVGNSILFSTSGTYNTMGMKRYDLNSGEIDGVDID